MSMICCIGSTLYKKRRKKKRNGKAAAGGSSLTHHHTFLCPQQIKQRNDFMHVKNNLSLFAVLTF